MSWLDNILSSGAIIWGLLFLIVLHIYLKKTDQTLVDLIKRIRDGWGELTTENGK